MQLHFLENQYTLFILDIVQIVQYTVRYMLQIISITEARNNLAKLIKKVKDTKEPIVIVQDSSPSVVIYPYDEAFEAEKRNQKKFQDQFQQLLKDGNKLGNKYLTDNKLPQTVSEEEAYDLIKNG